MSSLRTCVTTALALLLAVLTSAAGTAGVRPGTADGAELVKTGWWWAGNETPLDDTVVAPPQSSPPNVPKGALAVAAIGGEPDKMSAIEFNVDGEPGDLVESAVLVLRESAQAGANLNAEGAKILACPVTESFWADGASGAWRARPAFDCDLASAPGERGEDGVWTFDLTAVAGLWLVEGHRGSTSVALVEGAEAPESFQVAFDGPRADGVGYRFVVTEVPDTSPPAGGSVGTSGSNGTVGTGGTESGVGTGGGDLVAGTSLGSLGGGSAEAPMVSNSDLSPMPADEGAAAAAPPAAGEAVTAAATTPVAAVIPPWYAGLPKAGLLGVPLLLGLAYLMMLALGPDAQPAAGPTQRGVGRALERLRNAGAVRTTKGQG